MYTHCREYEVLQRKLAEATSTYESAREQVCVSVSVRVSVRVRVSMCIIIAGYFYIRVGSRTGMCVRVQCVCA